LRTKGGRRRIKAQPARNGNIAYRVPGSSSRLTKPEVGDFYGAAAALAQAATSGLFCELRSLQDADRSVGKVAGFLAAPQ
jgi:hypothetical protein